MHTVGGIVFYKHLFLVASVLSVVKIHDEYRLSGTKMASKRYFIEHKFNFNISQRNGKVRVQQRLAETLSLGQGNGQ